VTAADYLPIYEPVDSRGTRASLLLMACGALAWLAVGYGIAELLVLDAFSSGEDISAERHAAHRITGWIVLSVQLLLFSVTGLAFLDWLYQARINLRAFGARRLDYTRGWALGGFFVPLLQLWRPFAVMCEVWKASDPGSTDPFAWKTGRVSPMVAFWWVGFVLYVALEILAFSMNLAAAGEAPRIVAARIVGVVGDTSGALSATFGYFVVLRITSFQRDKRALTRDLVPSGDAPAIGGEMVPAR
jgi:hypothetical protein